jgi:hypothetical protein
VTWIEWTAEILLCAENGATFTLNAKHIDHDSPGLNHSKGFEDESDAQKHFDLLKSRLLRGQTWWKPTE